MRSEIFVLDTSEQLCQLGLAFYATYLLIGNSNLPQSFPYLLDVMSTKYQNGSNKANLVTYTKCNSNSKTMVNTYP